MEFAFVNNETDQSVCNRKFLSRKHFRCKFYLHTFGTAVSKNLINKKTFSKVTDLIYNGFLFST